jgi:hypothetical protein
MFKRYAALGPLGIQFAYINVKAIGVFGGDLKTMLDEFSEPLLSILDGVANNLRNRAALIAGFEFYREKRH